MDQYIVKRIALWPVTEELRQQEGIPACVDEYREAVAQFGPYEHETARAKALEIIEETGDDVEICRHPEGNTVAESWDGRLMIEEQHDDEGNRLPRDEWFDFWA